MNKRQLKKKKFELHYDEFETDWVMLSNGTISYSHKNQKPHITYECERDNGIYMDTWLECGEVSWKDIFYNLTNKKKSGYGPWTQDNFTLVILGDIRS